MNPEFSMRLQSLPPYIFSELNRLKAEAVARGQELVSLGIGDPDQPTPPAIIEKIREVSLSSQNHMYSPYEGTVEFRRSVARWMKKRFSVEVDPATEVIATIGSKEAIAHFPLAFCNPGDVCLFPSPGYPIFSTSVILAGGVPVAIPHRAEHGFLPDLTELEALLLKHSPKMMVLNFPSNPTSRVCPKEKLQELVNLALRHNTLLVYDNAYSELYFGDTPPVSILEIPGARECAIEMHSFSKSYNMTGWRLGFATGNARLVAGLLKAKTNIDSGPLLAVQQAVAWLLESSETFSGPIRDLYRRRRDVLVQELNRIGIESLPCEATLFVWARVPGGMGSMQFATELIEKASLVVTPGIGFGAEGEGFFRMALTVPEEELKRAARRLEEYLVNVS